ncbi:MULTISPECIES: phosphomannose isomerase type II C-terminal cupin domain [unclassified Nocardioides]|uniref:phosphomannose isomerase type II C-terminal cupin domain n=1 Tax=unclassified Nocardioides TaxID=2615069 RepID=UPI000056F2FA|nr:MULTISPECIES: phosphomannose isomerase type II C-terminal cupin domain [unclassified Nocardioides]ABL81110.1 mannose-6-phosphate isomerase, type 2 [Nocardioides sp. JS614]
MRTWRFREPSAAITSLARRQADVRPWGDWLVLDEGPGFKVKRLHVHPHARLSLQQHHFRAEAWIVVAGIATCQVGTRSWLASPGETAHVPRCSAHRLANQHDEELLVIEVQWGAETREDDIVRLADDYGRAGVA